MNNELKQFGRKRAYPKWLLSRHRRSKLKD